MKRPVGLRFYSQLESSGYGLAAVAYVRALVNAGLSVQWVPLVQRQWALAPLAPGEAPPLLAQARDDEELRDLPALLAATSRPISADTVLMHTTPENWALGFEAGLRNIGFTAWEADRLPPHWKPLLDQASAVCVPSEMNRAVFAQSGCRPPLHVVPHLRRRKWNRFDPAEIENFRAHLGIPANHFVFYTIATWEPRKNLAALVRAFAEAFRAQDAVTLVIKTGELGYGAPPFYPRTGTGELATALMERVRSELGRALPAVCLLPHTLTGRGMDLLHSLGDCYLSVSHGEAWGLGAFDAASRGTPVVVTGWGGQRDFLSDSSPGWLPVRMECVPIWPPECPSFWPPQRWAVPDPGATVRALQSVFHDPQSWGRDAEIVKKRIERDFGESVVLPRLLEALRG